MQRYEYPIELNYNIAVSRGIEVMPSVQYIRHPGGLDGDNATIVGLQVSLNF
nr:carbohydrate porin [Xanthomonas arboricola]